ncbi:IS200/IS605 family transposase [Roseivirga sp.]|uniref:IS200/IS605 family transposase n=1 Tax=Roseivirga sp. TaxID=1964215 RepID=UPI003B52F96C
MANTYSQLFIQTVFVVKYRQALLAKDWREKLMGVIGNLINETGCQTLIVNGVEDHVHCFFRLKPNLSVSEVMKSVKARSSKWINEQGFLPHRFEWQPGFGCFSYARSQYEAVYNYIRNQEKHHQKRTFRSEYLDLLEKFGIDYDEQYVFQDPQ